MFEFELHYRNVNKKKQSQVNFQFLSKKIRIVFLVEAKVPQLRQVPHQSNAKYHIKSTPSVTSKYS